MDQPWILIEQWRIIFNEERLKEQYDEKVANVRREQEAQQQDGMIHEQSRLGGL